ncbi:MAG: transposase [Phycisphaerales bacterium]|nr:transposase [Phycisphaerales bacterium]
MFMRSVVVHSGVLDDLVAALQTGVCDEAAALRLYALGSEAVKLALLAAARRIAEQAARIAELQTRPAGDPFATTPATPSGMIPVYLKANVRGKDAEATDRRRRKRPDFSPQRYATRIPRLTLRLDALVRNVLDHVAAGQPVDRDALRLCKRLRRTADHIFTFLDHPAIPFENNFAERMIRPAVILRKNSQSNRSDRGATTQAVLMSVYRTLKLRGHDPLHTLETALRTCVQTGQLPPLPDTIAADG